MKISFVGYTRPEPLTNFPALIIFGTNIPGFTYDEFISPVGADLRFVEGNFTNSLYYEIETWDPTGSSYVWVNLPVLKPNASIYAIWGNPAATVPPQYTTDGSTWDDSFVGVWHLDETNITDESTGGTHYDSTANALNGSQYYGDPADGQISGSQDLEGGNEYINIGSSSLFDGLSNSVTMSAWVRLSASANNPVLLARGGNGPSLRLSGSSRRPEFMSAGTWTTADDPVPLSSWHYVAGTFNDIDDLQILYVDGAPVATNVLASHAAHSGSMYLGRDSGGNYLDALLDETRISSEARSANWIWACYMMQVDNGNFLRYRTPPSSTVIIFR